MKTKSKIPALRFKGFTDAWEVRKLGSLTTVVRGASPRPIQDPKWFDKESDIGWLRIADVTEQNGRIYHLEQHISKLGQEKTRVLTEPHLLLSIAATVGKPVVNYVKTGVHDGFLIFLNPTFEREFMFQWLEMFRPKWQKYGQPGSQVNLNSELVRNQEIVLPNYKEQQKIGAFFKQLDDTIALHQRKLDLLKEQKKGYLQKMFPKNGEKVPELRFAGFADDWEERKLGDVTTWTKGQGLTKEDLNKERDGSEAVHYADLYKFSPVMHEVIHWTNSDDGQIIPDNSLLFPASDVTPVGLARTSTLRLSGVKAGGDVIIGQLDESINSSFMSYQINANSKKILPLITGTTVKHIQAKSLATVSVSITNMAEQTAIAGIFEQLDETIALHQRKLDLLKEQKKGFLQKMFPKNGEKVPELRFAGFADDWEERKLGDVTTWTKGQGLTKEDLNKERDGSEAVHYADLYKFSPVMHEVIHWTNSDDGQIIPDNSLLFPASDVTPVGLARTSTLRLSGVKAGGDVIIGQLDESINSSFMSYQINANSKKILPLITGTTVKHIQAKSLATVSVSITNMAEQTAIAGIFEQLDETIALHQRKLDLLKEQKKGFLQKMFV